MVVPDSFKKAIASTFYDKVISVYSTIDTVDNAGWAKRAGTTVVTGTFKGNVSFDRLDKVQEEYGITEQILIKITTDEAVELQTLLGYGGRQYNAYRVIQFDSHYLILGTKWLSRSLTSISA